MLDGPVRDVWFPLAERWAALVGSSKGSEQSPESQGIVATAVASTSPAASAPVVLAAATVAPTSAPLPVVSTPTGGTVLMLGDSLMGGVVVGTEVNGVDRADELGYGVEWRWR